MLTLFKVTFLKSLIHWCIIYIINTHTSLYSHLVNKILITLVLYVSYSKFCLYLINTISNWVLRGRYTGWRIWPRIVLSYLNESMPCMPSLCRQSKRPYRGAVQPRDRPAVSKTIRFCKHALATVIITSLEQNNCRHSIIRSSPSGASQWPIFRCSFTICDLNMGTYDV